MRHASFLLRVAESSSHPTFTRESCDVMTSKEWETSPWLPFASSSLVMGWREREYLNYMGGEKESDTTSLTLEGERVGGLCPLLSLSLSIFLMSILSFVSPFVLLLFSFGLEVSSICPPSVGNHFARISFLSSWSVSLFCSIETVDLTIPSFCRV